MPDGVLVAGFVVCALVSLAASWVLVIRLERVGAVLGFSEGLLGLIAALAADAPEITAAVTALGQHQSGIGVGVVIGSNVFNLAALLGVAAVIAGRIQLHRRVVVLEGVVALWVAAACVLVVTGLLPPAAGLLVVLAVLVPYVVLLGVRHDRLRRIGLPVRWVRWLRSAVVEEELELRDAVRVRRGGVGDAMVAGITVLVVVGASIGMEQSASRLGASYAVPEIVVGALVLAAVTSLPNAVAGVYLAARGRGAATLSTALNSNALNVAVGLLLPATVVGLGAPSGQVTFVAGSYFALTTFALAGAYVACGLGRGQGVLIICAYAAFAAILLATAYGSRVGLLVGAAMLAGAGVSVAAWMGLRGRTRNGTGLSARQNPPEPPRQLKLAQSASLGETRNGDRPDAAGRGGNSLVPGWSVARVWSLALCTTGIIAVADALLGHRVILIGLLIAGPCCGLLTGRWTQTAITGLWASALAVILGLPDQIWGTLTHLAFLGAVGVVSLVCTISAALIEISRDHA